MTNNNPPDILTRLTKASKCMALIASPNDNEALSAARTFIKVMERDGIQFIFDDNLKLREQIKEQARTVLILQR